MNRFRAYLLILFAGMVFFTGFATRGVYAEETASSPADPDTSVRERMGYWKKLKEENPEKFRELAQNRKKQIKERMKGLKESDPARYERIKEKHLSRRHERLKKLKEENPEKFHSYMQDRRKRLEKWKTENPERYENFLKDHPRVAQKIARREQAGGVSGERREVGKSFNEERPEKFQRPPEERQTSLKTRRENPSAMRPRDENEAPQKSHFRRPGPAVRERWRESRRS